MTIVDPAFAAQLVTTTGRVHVFDDLAGLAAVVLDGQVAPENVHGIWANLYLTPEQRIEVAEAVFLRSAGLRSPMSSGLAAFGSLAQADSVRTELGGEVMAWDAIVQQAGERADSIRQGSLPS